MAPLRRVSKFPIAAEKGIITTLGGSLVIPSKENLKSPLIGHEAPEIDLVDHEGRRCSLHATIALGRPIVLFFFPLAGSPHCTQESCMFRDALQLTPVFSDLNVIVIGISQDPPETLKRFHDKHRLTYRILYDEGRRVMNTYGVGSILGGLIDARCTFIIDPNGIIRGVAEGVFDAMGHLRFAERWLIRLEHELSLRARVEVDYAITSGDLAAYPQGDGTQVRRVLYGEAGSARGGGVGGAPRYGAASVAPTLTSTASSRSLVARTPKSSLVSDTSTATTSTMASSNGFWQEQGSNPRKGGLSGIIAQLSSADDQPPPMVASGRQQIVPRSFDSQATRTGETVASSEIHVDDARGGLAAARNGSSDDSSLHSGKPKTASLHSATRSKSKKGSGIGSLFRHKKKAPPIPPTYAHLDRQEEEYGEVERDSDVARSSSSGAASLMESQPSNGSLADLRTTGSGLAAAAMIAPTNGAAMPSAAQMSRKNSVPDIMPQSGSPRPRPVSSRPRSSSYRNSGFVGPSASSPVGSSSPGGPGSGGGSQSADSPPAWASGSGRRGGDVNQNFIEVGRSSKGPDDVPKDALDDDEEFVVQHTNGRLTFSPKPPASASSAPTPSQLNTLAAALSLRERDELPPILAAPEARPTSRGRHQLSSRSSGHSHESGSGSGSGSIGRASSRPASSKSSRLAEGRAQFGDRDGVDGGHFGSLPSRSNGTSLLTTELTSRSRTPVKRGTTPTQAATPPQHTPPPQLATSKVVPWGATPEGRSASATPSASSWNASSSLSRSPATVDTSTPSANPGIFARRPSLGDPNRSPRLLPRPAPPPVYAPPPPPSDMSHWGGGGGDSPGASPKLRSGHQPFGSPPHSSSVHRNGAYSSGGSSLPSSTTYGSLPRNLNGDGFTSSESATHGSESYHRNGPSSVAHSADKASPNPNGAVGGTPNPNGFSPNLHPPASPASSFSSHIFLDDARRPSRSSVESHGTFGGAVETEDPNDRTY